MDTNTSFGKLQKKEQRRRNCEQRGTWNGLNPVTKIVPSKKIYRRKKRTTRDDDLRMVLFFIPISQKAA